MEPEPSSSSVLHPPLTFNLTTTMLGLLSVEEHRSGGWKAHAGWTTCLSDFLSPTIQSQMQVCLPFSLSPWKGAGQGLEGLMLDDLPVYLPACLASLPVYRSLAERRSGTMGSCWMVWCSIRAMSPARLVMAALRFLSCSNSSSSLYHWQTDRHRERQTAVVRTGP